MKWGSGWGAEEGIAEAGDQLDSCFWGREKTQVKRLRSPNVRRRENGQRHLATRLARDSGATLFAGFALKMEE